jgi:hypothetical protein
MVETDWAAAHLDDPHLRILGCTIDRLATPTRTSPGLLALIAHPHLRVQERASHGVADGD